MIKSKLEKLLPLFMETTRDDMAGMRAALAMGDLETVRRLGHSLKGASLNYGFKGLGAIGLAIETAACQADVDEAARRIEELGRALEGLVVKFSDE